MIRWKKIGRIINREGTTNIYTGIGTDMTIESRRRHIPHAGGREGTWDHTTYFVVRNGEDVVEKYSLRDAKEFAEGLVPREDA